MAIARLGYEIDSSQAEKAAVDLDRMTASSQKAQTSARSLGTAATSAMTATGQYANSTRQATAATQQLDSAIDLAAAANMKLASSSNAASSAMRAQALSTAAANQNSRNLMFQLVDMGQTIPLLLQSPIHGLQGMGFQIAQIGQLYYGQGGMGAALRDMGSMLGGALARIAPIGAALAVLGVGFAALSSEMNEFGGTAVSAMDVARGAVNMFVEGVQGTLAPVIDAIAPMMATAWEGIGQFAIDEFNAIARGMAQLGSQIKYTLDAVVAVFQGAAAAAQVAWSSLPAALGDIVVSAANAVIKGVESMINRTIQMLNSFIETANGMISSLPFGLGTGLSIPTLGEVSFGGGITNPWAGSQKSFDQQMAAIREETLGKLRTAAGSHAERMSGLQDWNAFGDLTTESRNIAKASDALKDVEGAAGGAGRAVKGAAKEGQSEWEKLNEKINQAKETLGSGFGSILRGLVDKTMDWKDAIMQAGQALLKYANDLAMASGGPGIFGGGFLQGLLGSFLGFARGGAINRGNVIPFASGGVVTKPTVFPMANGAGLMGEAGPEGIIPLKRGPDGRLGVSNYGARNDNQPLAIELVSRFDADGGFHTAVERTSRPIAKQESAQASKQVVNAMPSMVDSRTDEREVRKIRPRGTI